MQLKKYYQPRKSKRLVSVNVEGNKVPLYGAGSTIVPSTTGVDVPLTLKFEIRSRGNVVGKLVRTKHYKQITCPLVLSSSRSKPIKFKKNTCTYQWVLFLWVCEPFVKINSVHVNCDIFPHTIIIRRFMMAFLIFFEVLLTLWTTNLFFIFAHIQ